MAYAYDRTMAAMDKDKDKANIFGQGQQGMGLTDTQRPNALVSDSSADIGGYSGGSNTGEKVKQSNDTASNAAISANVGRMRSPTNLQGLKQSVANAKGALQNQADAYVNSNTGPTALSDIDKTNLRAAVDSEANRGPEGVGQADITVGGPQQYAKNTMEHWSSLTPENIKKVDPFKADLNLKNQTIEDLGTDAGIQGLLRRSGGAEYTSGSAGFDQALLSQDAGFQKDRQDIINSYSGLKNDYDQSSDLVTKQGQDAANSSYGQYLTNMRENLYGLNNEFENEARSAEDRLEARAAMGAKEFKDKTQGIFNSTIKGLKNTGGQEDLSPYIEATGLNYQDYYKPTFDENQYGWKDYLDAGKAERFNNVMSLLGKGATYKAGSRADGFSESDLGSYDTNKLQSDLIASAKGRSDKAMKAKDAIAASKKAAEDQAAAAAAAAETAAAEAAAKKKAASEKAPYVYGKNAGKDVLHGVAEANKKTNEYLNLPEPFQNPGAIPIPEGQFTPAPFRKGGLAEGLNPSKVLKKLKIKKPKW